MKIILETERLELREMTGADTASLAAILQDEQTMVAYEGAFSDAETRSWLDRQLARYLADGFGLWAVVLKETGRMIGQAGITWQTVEDARVPEIGYLFNRAYWHHGYAAEAAAACKRYAFETLGFPEIFSIVRDTNLPSMNVAIRSGMTVCKRFVKHYRGVDMPHFLFGVKKEAASGPAALETADLILRPADTAFADELLRYFQRNKALLEPVEPTRSADFYTRERQEAQLRKDIAAAEAETGFRFYLFLKDGTETIIGSVALSQIVWGSFLSCFLSYRLDAGHLNKGYATQAARAISQYAFQTLGLHRVEANVMPRNLPSLRVLEKCGFQQEGLARRYLKINGVWEDHLHMVLLNGAPE